MKIRLASPIQKDSIVDGEGIRSVIWTQGCVHNCLGCHNPSTHSFEEGYLKDIEELKQEIASLKYQDGITLSGGDPFCQIMPSLEIASFCQSIGMNVWCYTGYTFEQLLEMSKHNPHILTLLENIDVLIDGKFMLELKSFDVKYRGSTNQRLIDVQRSLKRKETCLLENKEEPYSIEKRTIFV